MYVYVMYVQGVPRSSTLTGPLCNCYCPSIIRPVQTTLPQDACVHNDNHTMTTIRGMSLDKANIFSAIARLRRAMPRNDDVLAVCAAAERNVTAPDGNVTEPLMRNVTQASNVTSDQVGNVTCPACAARRLNDAARVKRHRAGNK